MANGLILIEQKLTETKTTNRLMVALGLDPADEKAQGEAFRYASSVLAEIKKLDSDPKRSLTSCNPDSIVQAMIDAATLHLAIDGRQHAHLVKFGNSVQFQIGYRGYIAKISEHYREADFTAEAVFKGDKLSVSDDGGFQSYKLEKSDPFAEGWANLTGVVVRLSYKKGDTQHQKVTTVSKGDLEKMRKAAKQDYIWSAWPIEKAKAAALKRACKIQFADVTGLQELIRHDNEANFDLDKLASPTRSTIIDNLVKSSEEKPDINVTPEHNEDGVVIEGDIVKTYIFKTSKTSEDYTADVWVQNAFNLIDSYTSENQLKGFYKANKEVINELENAMPDEIADILEKLGE